MGIRVRSNRSDVTQRKGGAMKRYLRTILAGMTVMACVVTVLLPAWPAPAQEALEPESEAFKKQRERLVDDYIEDPAAASRVPIKDKAVIKAMRTVQRHRFVPKASLRKAYFDRPLPIGHGQTISQPYVVATMTELLEIGPDSVVLEIGTGSGYQAAILAEIVKEVYTIEIIEELAKPAAERLKTLGYDNVKTRTGDGYFGWKEHAPFDGIVVTAAASHIPPPLVEQLKPGGKLVIPVGAPFQVQNLMVVEKREDGSVVKRSIYPVRFVPLTGGKKQAD